ncbi:T9SS type A sorting domain-containing protein [Labilibacter sediminis]|nr:T9SS type A sorting domain-containing protein [Labilibacter sediminis]
MKKNIFTFINAKLMFCFAAISLLSITPILAQTAKTGIRDNLTALQLTADMGVGWNLGNTLDAHGTYASGLNTETMWGNPKTTKAMITAVAEKGFKTIRIPVTWYNHVGNSPNYTIDKAWLDRVEEVVNYAFDNNMYVILNTHHEEDDWLEPTTANKDAAVKQLKKIWGQLATRFKDYGDYLIFETINEPRVHGSTNEWNGGVASERTVVNAFNKAAVDTIRNSGGNNAKRFLMCPTYAASYTSVALDDFVVPNNDEKVILSVHVYSPWAFSGTTNDKEWGTAQDKSDLKGVFNTIKTKFIDKNIAVVIGEWGTLKSNVATDRAVHAAYYTKEALAYKLTPVIWDDGGNFQLMDRDNCDWEYEPVVDSIINNSGINYSDDIISINTPESVSPGSTATVTVNYSSSTNRDIVVTFQLDSDPWTSYVDKKVDVTAGTGTLDIDIVIPDNTPVADNAYQFQTIITVDGGNWSTKIDNEANVDVSVTSGVANNVFQLIKRNATGYAIQGTSALDVNLYSANINSGTQQWNEIDRGNGYYSYQKKGTNYCIDGGNGGANGQNVKLVTCKSDDQNQHWKKVHVENDFYRLEKRNASGFSIAGGPGGANNQNVKLWSTGNYNQSQQWKFVSVSTTKSANLNTITSEETISNNSFSVYPNPANEFVTISINSENTVELNIYDSTGRKVFSRSNLSSSISIPTSEIGGKGIYLVKINSEIKKLVII